MKLYLKRIAKRETYTIGKLYVDGLWIADTIEDKDRGLTLNMSALEIKNIKVKTLTAIPTGTYTVVLNTISPKLSKKEFYQKFSNGGRVPRLLNVPGYDGVLIHVGNYATLSAGCILVGLNTVKGMVTNSKETFKKLYKILQSAKDKITITIE